MFFFIYMLKKGPFGDGFVHKQKCKKQQLVSVKISQYKLVNGHIKAIVPSQNFINNRKPVF